MGVRAALVVALVLALSGCDHDTSSETGPPTGGGECNDLPFTGG